MAIANISLFICQHDKLAEFPFSMANVEVEVVQTAPERVLRIGCLDQIILSTVFDTSYNIFPAPFRTLPFPGFPHWMNLDFGLWGMIIFHRV